jgi:SAM-dependent methyltransferase
LTTSSFVGFSDVVRRFLRILRTVKSGSPRLRRFARDVTPPALARLVRKTRGASTSGDVSRARGPLNPDHIEYGADFYDETFEAEDRWREPYWKLIWYASWSVIADRVVRSEGARVLDMGCGAGHLARLLADRGLAHYTGFDFSSKRLEQARRVVPEFRFEVADAYTTDLFATVDYNAVVCTEFLEHLEGDLDILRRIRGGTRVLGTVPNYDAHAHLRFFHSAQEVVDRYEPCFSQLTVDQVHNVGGGSEWLIDGELRA